MKSVLIVDDDVALGSMIREYLDGHQISLSIAHSGETGLEVASRGQFDLMLLDVMLPGVDGFEVLRRLRTTSDLSVLLLSARGEPADRIRGLQLGADDYLPKPFEPEELVARIEAVLRRSSKHGSEAAPAVARRIRVGDLTVERSSKTAWYKTFLLYLTDIEFLLLEMFAESPETVLTREKLVAGVFGREFHPLNRNLDMHVSRLRRKLHAANLPGNAIRTVRSEGYLFSVKGL